MSQSLLLGSLPSSISQDGHQRLWYWRGWRIRYWFAQPAGEAATRAPLVFIHGFGANLNQWRHNLPALSGTAPVYALDLLGFGDSEKAATLYGAELWAEQVANFIQTVVGRPAIVVGHSLGALVALTVATQHSDWVERLALITLPLSASREDLVAGWVDKLARWVESGVANPLLLRVLFASVRRPSLLRKALRGIYLDPDRVDDDLVRTFANPPQERGAARTLCYLVRSRSTENFSPSIQTMLEQLSTPTLLLWGEQDRVIPIAKVRAYIDAEPSLSLLLLPEAGHCLYDEQPQQFNQLIQAWSQNRPVEDNLSLKGDQPADGMD
jgi:pimeloyl-ACP methyl ester carboxylesterase